MKNSRKIFSLLGVIFLPSFLLRFWLRFLGHQIGKNSKIGFSIIITDKIELLENAKIGHFNFIAIPFFSLDKNSSIKHFNIFKGPFNLLMKEESRIANQNFLTRAKKGITYGESSFELGMNSNITSKHFLDLTKSITIGSNTVLGGRSTQIWTHGYVHKELGSIRLRIDGEVIIGNNVYIGSNCFINPGVTIANAISIGGGTSVATNLLNKGMYVSQKLRFIEQDFETIKAKLKKVENENLVEEVYLKIK